MIHEDIDIRTEDGTCPAHVFRPPGSGGPWPAILFFMDGIGIRPAMFEMGVRMAARGYYVLLPDLFYRSGKYPPKDAKRVFSDPVQRKDLMENFIGKLGQQNAMRDAHALINWLSIQKDVVQPKIGVTGYCMGGYLALAAAGTFPSHIAAAAAFHPGNIATDAPDSPHLLASRIKARVYVGGAKEDPSFTDEQKARFEAALAAAGVAHVVETFDARHGWVPSDTPVHDGKAAERHWEKLFELFDAVLKNG